jgi:CheY-like chemotaxis protein
MMCGQRQFFILHAEDDQAVAGIVKETLEAEGCNIETCGDGATALEKIASDAHYDLLLLDNELPGVNGLELIRSARGISHRRETPIVLLSGNAIEREALDAGANAFLHKPEGISALAATIARLLRVHEADNVNALDENSDTDLSEAH